MYVLCMYRYVCTYECIGMRACMYECMYVTMHYLMLHAYSCISTKYSASQIVYKVFEQSAGVDTHFFFAEVIDVSNDQSIFQVSAFRFREGTYSVFHEARPADTY